MRALISREGKIHARAIDHAIFTILLGALSACGGPDPNAPDPNKVRDAKAPAEFHFPEVERVVDDAVKAWLPEHVKAYDQPDQPPSTILRIYMLGDQWKMERAQITRTIAHRYVNIMIFVKAGSGNCYGWVGDLAEEEKAGVWGSPVVRVPDANPRSVQVTCESVERLPR